MIGGPLLLGGVLLVLLAAVVVFLTVEAAYFGREFIEESPSLSRLFSQQQPQQTGEREDAANDTSLRGQAPPEGRQRRSRDTIRRMIDYFEDTPE
jgi:hypothetical protein